MPIFIPEVFQITCQDLSHPIERTASGNALRILCPTCIFSEIAFTTLECPSLHSLLSLHNTYIESRLKLPTRSTTLIMAPRRSARLQAKPAVSYAAAPDPAPAPETAPAPRPRRQATRKKDTATPAPAPKKSQKRKKPDTTKKDTKKNTKKVKFTKPASDPADGDDDDNDGDHDGNDDAVSPSNATHSPTLDFDTDPVGARNYARSAILDFATTDLHMTLPQASHVFQSAIAEARAAIIEERAAATPATPGRRAGWTADAQALFNTPHFTPRPGGSRPSPQYTPRGTAVPFETPELGVGANAHRQSERLRNWQEGREPSPVQSTSDNQDAPSQQDSRPAQNRRRSPISFADRLLAQIGQGGGPGSGSQWRDDGTFIHDPPAAPSGQASTSRLPRPRIPSTTPPPAPPSGQTQSRRRRRGVPRISDTPTPPAAPVANMTVQSQAQGPVGLGITFPTEQSSAPAADVAAATTVDTTDELEIRDSPRPGSESPLETWSESDYPEFQPHQHLEVEHLDLSGDVDDDDFQDDDVEDHGDVDDGDKADLSMLHALREPSQEL